MQLPVSLIESPRLFIRAYTTDDAPALFRLISAEKESLKNYFPLTVESTTSLAATRTFIKTRIKETKEGTSASYGIFEKKTGALIGQIAVREINWRVPKCELGYFIISEKRGQSFAPEAVNAIAEFCIEKAGMVKLMLRIQDTNSSSKRVAEKCGFTYSGTLRNDFRSSEGRLMDCEVWEKIAGE